ncbi:hypothetical protein [Dyadobacter frigoris]|nr:hypothetical protein [Dyadobacter frigoris]
MNEVVKFFGQQIYSKKIEISSLKVGAFYWTYGEFSNIFLLAGI